MQVICTIPVLINYWANLELKLEISEYLNDDVAKTVHDHPKNYIDLGTVPMQDTDLAIKVQNCKEIGLVCIQIGLNINDLNLSEPQFPPFPKHARGWAWRFSYIRGTRWVFKNGKILAALAGWYARRDEPCHMLLDFQRCF